MEATVEEVKDAFRALSRISEENRLVAKSAWRVSRMLGKLKPVVKDFEHTQLKLYRDAGGVQSGNGIVIEPPARDDDESETDYRARLDAHNQKMNSLIDQMQELGAEKVSIDYDPLPFSLLGDESKLSPNDLSALGPFITEG